MLEETLSKHSEYSTNPAETSLAILSFLQQELILGGSVTEQRFVRLFMLLVDHIFGSFTPSCSVLPNNNTSVQFQSSNGIDQTIDEKEKRTLSSSGSEHCERGGWLSQSERWTIDTDISENNNIGSMSLMMVTGVSLSKPYLSLADHLRLDPVVHLLSGTGSNSITSTATSHQGVSQYKNTNSLCNEENINDIQHQNTRQNLVDAMEKIVGSRFPMPLCAFPGPSLLTLLSLLNSSILFLDKDRNVCDRLNDRIRFSCINETRKKKNAMILFGDVLYSAPKDQPQISTLFHRCRSLLHQQQSSLTSSLNQTFMIIDRKGDRKRIQTGGRVKNTSNIMINPMKYTKHSKGGSYFSSVPETGFSSSPCNFFQTYGETTTCEIYESYSQMIKKEYIMLTMLEFFMVLFVRYPLEALRHNHFHGKKESLQFRSNIYNSIDPGFSKEEKFASGDTNEVNSPLYHHNSYSHFQRKSIQPYGEAVYEVVFRSYLRRYFPHDFEDEVKVATRTRRNFVYDTFNGTKKGGLMLEREAEFFLRIVIEFWLEGENMPPVSMELLDRLEVENKNVNSNIKCNGSHISPMPCSTFSHKSQHHINNKVADNFSPRVCHERRRYISPPSLVQNCIRLLVNHFITDPALACQCVNNDICGLSTFSSIDVGDNTFWPLTPALTILQLPLYNYICLSLRHSPVHNVDSGSFITAINIWLVLVEPWNVAYKKRKMLDNDHKSTHTKDYLHIISDRVVETVVGVGNGYIKRDNKMETYSSIIIPKAMSTSKYSSVWKFYVAANLHMYTVPFKIFLHRAKEFDFSSRVFHKSLLIIQQVFRVFSSRLMETLSEILTKDNTDKMLSTVFLRHCDILGELCQINHPAQPLDVFSCRQEVQNLLEEIFFHHRKSLGERGISDRLFRIGSGTVLALENLIKQAKVIVDMSVDYKTLYVVGGNFDGITCIDSSPEMIDGIITEKGRKQIIVGTRICSSTDIMSIGDPMYSRVKSYENPSVVHLSVQLSHWINQRLGLVSCVRPKPEKVSMVFDSDKDKSSLLLRLVKEGKESRTILFRINLRFLADKRNLIAIIIFLYISIKILQI